MRASLRQLGAVARINLLSLPQRTWMSLSAVVAIALVVFVLLGALALDAGFGKAVGGTGSEGVAIALREGASSETNSSLTHEQQLILAAGPGIARKDDRPLVSSELVVLIDGVKKATGTRANLALRGVGPLALDVHDGGMRIVAGRMFASGTNEMVVGAGAAEAFEGFGLGDVRRIGGSDWKVVGIFGAGGSVLESEILADIATVQSRFNRGDVAQSMRIRLEQPSSIASLIRYARSDPRLHLEIKSEKAYYAKQAERSGDLLNIIAKPLAFVLAIGALSGALNAMYSSVSARAVEISTLRALGFGGGVTFLGTMIEALALALAGAAIGGIAGYLIFNGMSASTTGFSRSQVVFHLSLSPWQVLEGAAWAAAIGLVGGLFPAWRAATRRLSVASE